MTPAFVIIASLTIAAAVSAMGLRNLVHCALALVVAFAGLAALYLQLDAQFVGFAQILVYIGAVAILVVFAILLTRSGDTPQESVLSGSWIWGTLVAISVFVVLCWAVTHSGATQKELTAAPSATVKGIGEALMGKYVLPLEVIGLLLTAALIGAVIIAMRDEAPAERMDDGGSKAAHPATPSSISHSPTSGGAA